MTINLTDTTSSTIDATLTRARHKLGGPTMGMVMTLVVITDESYQYDAVRAATEAGREHPSRVIVVIARDPHAEPRIDAEIRVAESGPGELVLLRLYGDLGEHADSVVAPLLLLDIPVVTWWPGAGPDRPPAQAAMGAFAQRRITDAAAAEGSLALLTDRAAGYRPGDTDFAWSRLTPWRTLLAATVDQPFPGVTGATVGAARGNASGDLLAAWLQVRLHVPVTRLNTDGPGITEVHLHGADGDIAITRPDGRVATLSRTGSPDRMVALHRRSVSELLAEELRRLDPDEIYAEVLAGLAASPPRVTGDRSEAVPAGAGDPAGEQRPGKKSHARRATGSDA